MTMVGATLKGALNATGQFAGHKAQTPQLGFSDVLARMPRQQGKREFDTPPSNKAPKPVAPVADLIRTGQTDRYQSTSMVTIMASKAQSNFGGALAAMNTAPKRPAPVGVRSVPTAMINAARISAKTDALVHSAPATRALQMAADQRATAQFALNMLPSAAGGIQILIRKAGAPDSFDSELAEQLSFLLARSGYRLAGVTINGYAYGAANQSVAGDN